MQNILSVLSSYRINYKTKVEPKTIQKTRVTVVVIIALNSIRAFNVYTQIYSIDTCATRTSLA